MKKWYELMQVVIDGLNFDDKIISYYHNTQKAK